MRKMERNNDVTVFVLETKSHPADDEQLYFISSTVVHVIPLP